MIKNIRHTGIVVRDLNKSYNFYTELGFKTKSDEIESGEFLEFILGIKNCSIRIIKMVCNEQMIELLKYQTPKSNDAKKLVNSIGCSNIAMTVKNIEVLYNKLSNLGVNFINPPLSNGVVKVAFCKDPNDVYLELVEEL